MLKYSRQLRRDQTPWEKKLWMYLKGKNFYGFKFRRQVVVGSYIYDFLCFDKKLIIELDGGQHVEKEIIKKDKSKQKYAEDLGYKLLRFYNNDVHNNLQGVLETIHFQLTSGTATPSVARMHSRHLPLEGEEGNSSGLTGNTPI